MKIVELSMSELTGIDLDDNEFDSWYDDPNSYEKFELMKNIVESASNLSTFYMYYEVCTDDEDDFNNELLNLVSNRPEPICVKSKICYSSSKGRFLSVAVFGNSIDQIKSLFEVKS